MSLKLKCPKTEVLLKLKCYQNWNVTKSEKSKKSKYKSKSKSRRLALITLVLFNIFHSHTCKLWHCKTKWMYTCYTTCKQWRTHYSDKCICTKFTSKYLKTVATPVHRAVLAYNFFKIQTCCKQWLSQCTWQCVKLIYILQAVTATRHRVVFVDYTNFQLSASSKKQKKSTGTKQTWVIISKTIGQHLIKSDRKGGSAKDDLW